MSKENGVFKYFFRKDKVYGERYCITVNVGDMLGNVRVLDNTGTIWDMPLSKYEKDGDINWNTSSKIDELMITMRDMRASYLQNRGKVIRQIKDKLYTGNEMLKMSFYNGTLDRQKAQGIIEKTDRPLLYTYGFEYRHPTTHRKPIDKEKAYEIIDKEGYLDIDFESDHIHLNAYSDNDMW